MEEILHQLIGSLSHHSEGLHMPGGLPEFFHQQYEISNSIKNRIDSSLAKSIIIPNGSVYIPLSNQSRQPSNYLYDMYLSALFFLLHRILSSLSIPGCNFTSMNRVYVCNSSFTSNSKSLLLPQHAVVRLHPQVNYHVEKWWVFLGYIPF